MFVCFFIPPHETYVMFRVSTVLLFFIGKLIIEAIDLLTGDKRVY